MSLSSVMDALSEVEFLHNISTAHLERLSQISTLVEYPRHAEIFHESDEAKYVYLIVEGRVSLIVCEPKLGRRQLMEVNSGEMFGWSPLVGRYRLSDTAKAMTPVKVLEIDGPALLAFCESDPEFGFQFMHRAARVLADRLTATRMRLLEMGGLQLPPVQVESD